jgi:outer membrane protein
MKALLLIIFFWAQYALGEDSLNLSTKDIKTFVETRNERVASKEFQTHAMSYRQGFLKRSFLPSLKIRAAQERFQLGDNYRRTQPDYGAEVSVNLFNGTKDSLHNEIINKKKERIGSEKRITLYEEIVKAKEIYWTLVYLNRALETLGEIKEINSANLKSAQRRIRSGVTTSADRYEFEIKNIELKRTIDQVNLQRKKLEREILNLLGYDDVKKLVLTDKMDHFEGMEKIGEHTESQHQFLAKPALVRAEENEISAKMQSRSWWPQVDAYVARNQYNVRNGNVFDAQEGRETVVGVRMTMNLFDFSSGNREASALKAEAQGSKSEARYLVREVENEAHTEIEALDFLHRQVHDAEENIQRAQGYVKLTLDEYMRGVKNSPDVLGSVDKLLEVKTKYLEILRDFYVTRDHLLSKNEI